jgi:hypothetical protein
VLKHELMDSRRDRGEAAAKQLALANEENWAVLGSLLAEGNRVDGGDGYSDYML